MPVWIPGQVISIPWKSPPPTNERDVVPALIWEDDEVVYGNAGYSGIRKREEIKTDPHLS